MAYSTARERFEDVKKNADSPALRQLADGLIELSRALEADIRKVQRAVDDIKRG